jgi:hypothetical protein
MNNGGVRMPDGHLQAIIATHLPALELVIARAISRNPGKNSTFSKIKDSRRKKEEQKTVRLQKGVVEIFAPKGVTGDLFSTPLTISLPYWFAEATNLLEIFNRSLGDLSVDFNDTHILITVIGTKGLTNFEREFTTFIPEQIGHFTMPHGIGLDTEVIGKPKKVFRGK